MGLQAPALQASLALALWGGAGCTAGESTARCASRQHHPGSSPWNSPLHQGAFPFLLPVPAVPFTPLPTLPAGAAGPRKALLRKSLQTPRPRARLPPCSPSEACKGEHTGVSQGMGSQTDLFFLSLPSLIPNCFCTLLARGSPSLGYRGTPPTHHTRFQKRLVPHPQQGLDSLTMTCSRIHSHQPPHDSHGKPQTQEIVCHIACA